MKIILVTRFYPPDTGGGGIAAYARYAALGLLRAGHKVVVISAQAAGSLPFQTVEEINVYRVPIPFSAYSWTRLPLLGRQIRFFRDLVYAWRVRQLLTSGKLGFIPDIAEYADIDAESFFHPASFCPHVVKLHTPHSVLKLFYSAREIPYALDGIEWMEKKSLSSAQGVSSPSLYLSNLMMNIVQPQKINVQYVPNFIDTEKFSPSSDADLSPKPIVLYVGRLEPRKGAVIFANAIPSIARRFPLARFVFLGADRVAKDGISQKAHLEQFLNREGLRECVEFHGHSSPEVFLSFYRQASVFVLPSMFENSPYTLLEAMSCGKPCVVSRAGGMTEMLDDGKSGLLFESGNSADLAEKVNTLLTDQVLRISMGQAARRHAVQEYGLEAGAAKTSAFYQSVLSGIG